MPSASRLRARVQGSRPASQEHGIPRRKASDGANRGAENDRSRVRGLGLDALTGCELEIATGVIFEIDPDTLTIIRGRYYSEPVNRGGLKINDWMQNLSTAM
jgi:hypothetical protein